MNRGMKSFVIVVIILAIAVIAYISLHRQSTKLPKQVVIDTTNQPTTGNPNAKFQIVAFEDLKCHNCMRYNVEIYPKIEKELIKTGKAKYTVINIAFIPGSILAANAARCVYTQNKKLFFPYIKTIYMNQPPESQNWATIPNLVNFAKGVKGINQKKLSQCIYRSPYTNFINNNLKIGNKAMGQVATPTLFVNGYIVKPLSVERIKQIMKAAG